ncbi:hypothetical protein JXL21_03810 [Candidatus Bathyarchaeota archaeon]|nr:hypothetical protein [Candidatus Bathyarchaeota archaeon]
MIDLQTTLTYLTLISVPVGVFYHIMTLNNTRRNQRMTLETRQAQLFMNIYNQSHANQAFMKAWRTLQQKEFETPEEFCDAYFSDSPEDADFIDSVNYVGSFFEGVGVFVREGYLDIRLVALLMTGFTKHFWQKMAPLKEEMRVKRGYTVWLSETEYLFDRLEEYLKKNPELHYRPKSPLKAVGDAS